MMNQQQLDQLRMDATKESEFYLMNGIRQQEQIIEIAADMTIVRNDQQQMIARQIIDVLELELLNR